MITNFTCTCGCKEAKFYDGALGYEAVVCKNCGRYSDEFGEHAADQWSLEYIKTDYQIFICSGTGENYRESGSYTHSASSYENAASIFGKHWNECTCNSKYGNSWQFLEKRKGLPKNHSYYKDDRNNILLLIKQN